VTRRSGKTSVVLRRYACNKRLANALYHWARLATQHDALSRRRYAATDAAEIATAGAAAAPYRRSAIVGKSGTAGTESITQAYRRYSVATVDELQPDVQFDYGKSPAMRLC
jgi:hypothetical protein